MGLFDAGLIKPSLAAFSIFQFSIFNLQFFNPKHPAVASAGEDGEFLLRGLRVHVDEVTLFFVVGVVAVFVAVAGGVKPG